VQKLADELDAPKIDALARKWCPVIHPAPPRCVMLSAASRTPWTGSCATQPRSSEFAPPNEAFLLLDNPCRGANSELP
jgi:hypothetical protein